MITLEQLEKAIGLFTVVCGGIIWMANYLQKKAKKEEQLRQWCKRIDEKLLSLEANDGRIAEEVEEVRRDFGRLMRQLLSKK